MLLGIIKKTNIAWHGYTTMIYFNIDSHITWYPNIIKYSFHMFQWAKNIFVGKHSVHTQSVSEDMKKCIGITLNREKWDPAKGYYGNCLA